MVKEPIFEGAATALITPMKDGFVDFKALGELIDWQIENGIDALVIAGTTGEGSTLTDEEHREVLRFSYERAAKRVPMIAGTGSNDTAYAIELTKFAEELGYEAALVVTPYYNKATQKGLIDMYTRIADTCDIPLILYDVPSRTGVAIAPETYAALASHPRIAAIKEANGDISKIAKTVSLVGDKLDLYSGNDDQVIPVLSLGGKGVISVLSNLLPYETSEMVHAYLRGETKRAAQMQLAYLPLIDALFSEVNPIPVKAAMAHMGFCENEIRSPLTEMEDAHKAILFAEMDAAGVCRREN